MDDTLLQKNLDNHFRAIDLCMDQGLRMPALILIYSAIDFLAWLARPKVKDDVDRKQFIAWADRYIVAAGFSQCSATDLYSARCAHLHGNNFESSMTRKGEALAVLYAWGNADPTVLLAATKLIPKPKVRVVHVETLIAAVKAASENFMFEARGDQAKWELILSRSDKLFDENPELDGRVNALFKSGPSD